jgi:hypothetical protein
MPVGHSGRIALRRAQCSVYSHCYAMTETNEYTTAVSRQRIGKHVPTMNTHAKIGTIGNGICTLSVQRGYNEHNWSNPVSNFGSHFDPISWIMQGRLRRDGAIVQGTVQLWAIRRTMTAQKLKNLHC